MNKVTKQREVQTLHNLLITHQASSYVIWVHLLNCLFWKTANFVQCHPLCFDVDEDVGGRGFQMRFLLCDMVGLEPTGVNYSETNWIHCTSGLKWQVVFRARAAFLVCMALWTAVDALAGQDYRINVKELVNFSKVWLDSLHHSYRQQKHCQPSC